MEQQVSAQRARTARVESIAKKATTPGVALGVFIVAIVVCVVAARLLWPDSFDHIVAISAGAAGVAIVLWGAALWNWLSSLQLVPEVAPLDIDNLPTVWARALVSWGKRHGISARRHLPPATLLLGYILGKLIWS